MSFGLVGNPSHYLEGKKLPNNWFVEKKVSVGKNTTNGTGGNFTVAYEVTNKNNDRAFLKALDYSSAMSHPRQSEILNAMSSAYLFECEVLNKCNQNYLDRVVRALETNSVYIDEPEAKGQVEYIIFEMAEGDVRKHLKKFSQNFDTAWRLRSLHHIATGLKQLHNNNIAHQDLKPSNVLIFDQRISKLADLGRASFQGHNPDHDNYLVAGDPSYAPLDLAYGYTHPDWKIRRIGCDFYHLGCMIVFFFTGVSMTALTLKHLDKMFHPSYFNGQYNGKFKDVLPYVREAFGKASREFSRQISNTDLRNELTEIIRQLCEPDVLRRGRSSGISSNKNSYSLVKYVTRFDLLARRAEVGHYKKVD